MTACRGRSRNHDPECASGVRPAMSGDENMSRIRILSEEVATQIAAGEVVERPASVVRELLDNSLDAGADRIEIRMESGGRRLLRVSDNGQGMDRDDLLLCVERHATSKVRELDDLFSIGTLGFRGEAIPSIASISRLEMTSRTAESVAGNRIRVDGGRLVSIEEVGAPPGTIVSVRDLFFNTPARRKFLKTAKTESYHVLETVSRIAVPFNQVTFRLLDGERTLLHYPAATSEVERLAMLLGRETAERMELVERAVGPVIVRAHLAPPHLSRSRADRILIYVNGRNVRDRILTRAVMEGYGQRLMKGRYPQAVVFLDMDPALVDINVHPTKQEVRFHDGRRVYQAVASAVDQGLYGSAGGIMGPRPSETRGLETPPLPPFFQAGGTAESPWTYEPGSGPVSVREPLPGPPVQATFQGRPRIVIGQLRNTYILCQTEDGLLMVDQHAAHERIVFESLTRTLSGGSIPIQPFLIPKRVELTAREVAVLEENADTLVRVGLEIEPFGGTTVLLRAVPAVLVDADSEAFLRELLARLMESGGGSNGGSGMDDVLAVMACHGSVRAGKALSEREMTSLLEELENADLPTNCPHGRPVSRLISWSELERMFKRTV